MSLLYSHLLATLLKLGTLPYVQVNNWTRKLWAAVLAEFVGMAVFEIYGGNAPDSVAAYGNGITLGILGERSSLNARFSMPRPTAVNCWNVSSYQWVPQ